MSTDEILVGLGVTVILAVASQIFAARFRLPGIVVLLPVGFTAGQFIHQMRPAEMLGDAFSPLVALAVALILFEGGLDLVFADLDLHGRRVVRRLLSIGIPVTLFAASAFSYAWLGLSKQAAFMLGAILVVSGPTVVGPLLETSRPGHRVASVLNWEGTTIDPVGAILGALVFQMLVHHVTTGHGRAIEGFFASIGVGLIGAVVGTALLWFLLARMRLHGILATEAILAVVVGSAALCDAVRDDTGLIAAIGMGVAIANLGIVDLPEDRRFFHTIVQLTIGLLFISISAMVTFDAVKAVFWPTMAVVGALVVFVRPTVTVFATHGTSLTWRERTFIGWMCPRGIVAASTAASFSAPLAAAGIVGADELLPATFLVIVATVALYGLTAPVAVRLLGLGDHDATDDEPTVDWTYDAT